MRKSSLTVFLVVGNVAAMRAQGSNGLAAQPVDAKTRVELEQAREGVWRAWFAGDVAALERLIPAGLAAGSPGGWEDRRTTLDGARRSAASGRRLVEIRFDSTMIRLRGNTAVMQAKYFYVLELPNGARDTTRGVATEVFVRQNQRWVNPFWYLE